MDNIKFLYFRPTGYGKGYSYSGHVDLVFEVCPKVTKYLREHSECPSYLLCNILDENGHYCYCLSRNCGKEDLQWILQFIRKVEQISNEKDEEYVISHIITDNGKMWADADYQKMFKTKYDDMKEDEMTEVKAFFGGLRKLLLNVWID